MDKLLFFHINGNIFDLENMDKIVNAEIFLYYGGYYLTSCLSITDFNAHILYTKSKEDGSFEFFNLNQG